MNYSIYPPNWKSEIRPFVLSRAGNCCEICQIENHRIGYRQKGRFIPVDTIATVKNGKMILHKGYKLFKIVLTISHKNHDPENWDVRMEDLQALCQRCHLQYDAAHHSHSRAKRKGIGTMEIF